jgi:hypothetical protein
MKLLAWIKSLFKRRAPLGDSVPFFYESDVVTRLCQHIVHKRGKMIVDINHPPAIIWSDGAILEVGTMFSDSLQELISRPTQYHDIQSFVTQLDVKSPQWRGADVTCSLADANHVIVRTLDDKISTTVEALYIQYLGHRYPAATIRMRGELEPVIFVVDGKIRASLMPVKF